MNGARNVSLEARLEKRGQCDETLMWWMPRSSIFASTHPAQGPGQVPDSAVFKSWPKEEPDTLQFSPCRTGSSGLWLQLQVRLPRTMRNGNAVRNATKTTPAALLLRRVGVEDPGPAGRSSGTKAMKQTSPGKWVSAPIPRRCQRGGVSHLLGVFQT